ncbi:MAG: FUN14 domain-containing protein [Candidatus Nitrosopolaris sp.]
MLTSFRIIERKEATELQIDEFVFSGGGGFLFGTAAGYAIKKVMKIVAVVVGLFVAALAYLEYKGLIDVKWVAMENVTRSAVE